MVRTHPPPHRLLRRRSIRHAALLREENGLYEFNAAERARQWPHDRLIYPVHYVLDAATCAHRVVDE